MAPVATSGARAAQRPDYQQAHQAMATALPSWPATLRSALAQPLCAAVLRLVALGMSRGWSGQRGAAGLDGKRAAAADLD